MRKHFAINGVDPADRLRIVQAILDAVEDGASTHCRRQTFDQHGNLDSVDHLRLDVGITFYDS